MEVITRGFQNEEVAEHLKNLCKKKIEQGMSEFLWFGKLYGAAFDIAYVGNNTIVISNY